MKLPNNDKQVEYIITPFVPSDWEFYITESITLSPGQSCFIEYSIYVPESTLSGIYNISFFVNGTTEDGFIVFMFLCIHVIPGIYSSLHEDTIYAQFAVTNSGDASCSPNSPIITVVTPASQLYYIPGGEFSFAFSIENTDSTSCHSSYFSYNVSLPSTDWFSYFLLLSNG